MIIDTTQTKVERQIRIDQENRSMSITEELIKKGFVEFAHIHTLDIHISDMWDEKNLVRLAMKVQLSGLKQHGGQTRLAHGV